MPLLLPRRPPPSLPSYSQGQVKHYVFVASAGAYADDPVQPERKEGETPRKAKAGHVAVEAYLASEGLPYTVFQPLYLYGPHTNKDCEQFFMDRVLRWVVEWWGGVRG